MSATGVCHIYCDEANLACPQTSRPLWSASLQPGVSGAFMIINPNNRIFDRVPDIFTVRTRR
jgi:hypothetical protein